jgi:ketosteroid isomerase-like protein
VSSENLEIVRRVLGCLAEQDVEAALEDVDADAILDWSDSDALDAGVYSGHAGWRAFLEARDEALGERRFDSVELLTADANTVVLVGRVRERGRASGIEVSTTGAVVWRLRDGKIVSFKIYQSSDAALKAVGLEE